MEKADLFLPLLRRLDLDIDVGGAAGDPELEELLAEGTPALLSADVAACADCRDVAAGRSGSSDGERRAQRGTPLSR